MTFQRGDKIMFMWAPATCTKVGLHDWHGDETRFVDTKHFRYVCSVCRASGAYTPLEIQGYITLRNERLSAQETRRGRK